MGELVYEANQAFYEWELKSWGNESPLSDTDRIIFVTGYLLAKSKIEELA